MKDKKLIYKKFKKFYQASPTSTFQDEVKRLVK